MTHKDYPMLQKFAAIAGLAFLLAACSEGGDNKPAEDGQQAATEAVADTAADATPQASPEKQSDMTYGEIVFGSADAPVEIIEYASLTCPACGRFANLYFPEIEKKYIDTGKVRFIYRNFESNQVGLAASTVARCGDMETARKLTKALFAKQDQWLRSEDPLGGMASVLRRFGISRTKFDRCLSNKDIHKDIVKMTQEGVKQYNVNATPTIFVNGKKAENYSSEKISEMVDAAL